MSDTLAPFMPRPATGSIESHPWKDGRTVSFRARVRGYGRRWRIDFGTNHEGWSKERARVELETILAKVERRTWEPPAQRMAPAELCLAGPRISELTDAPRARLDLHGGCLRVGDAAGDAKTEAGLRDIELTFYLQGELRGHLAHTAGLGRPSSARSPIFPTC